MEKNKERIKEIETKYFAANEIIAEDRKDARIKEGEAFEIREKFKDSSINYPTYGRGLKKPGIELNTFMVQEKMCADTSAKNKSNPNSPKADVQAQ
jgi:hypothetical protein